jgi:hypothetical protein
MDKETSVEGHQTHVSSSLPNCVEIQLRFEFSKDVVEVEKGVQFQSSAFLPEEFVIHPQFDFSNADACSSASILKEVVIQPQFDFSSADVCNSIFISEEVVIQSQEDLAKDDRGKISVKRSSEAIVITPLKRIVDLACQCLVQPE